MARLSLFPADAVAVAEALRCPSLSYTYSEPTAFYEYTYDTCKAARERKLKNIVVSCGSIEDRPARDLYQLVDAAHVDLKGFDQEIYTKLNSGKLQPILNTLKTLKELGVWFEIINLVVPTYTDNVAPSAACAPGSPRSWDRTSRCTSRASIRSTSWSTSRRRPSRRS